MTFHDCRAGDDEPPVPGVVLDERLTDAGAGEVWGGRIEAGGEPCTVRRLRLPSDPLVRDHVAQAGRVLTALDHPHVATVLDVRATREGAAVVSAPVPRPVSLATVLRARGRVEPGEVVTIGMPLAQALATLHEAGLTHGRLCPQDVLLEPDGRPVLAGTGVAGLLGSAGRPADDVRALAAMLLDAMSGSVGSEAAAVAVAVSPALVDEPTRRPTATELADALAGSCPPTPVRLTPRGAAPLPVGRPGPRRRRQPRLSRPPVLPALGVLVALVLAACVGWSTAGGQAQGASAGQDAAQVPAAEAGPDAGLDAPSDVTLADRPRVTVGPHLGRAASAAGRPRRDDLSRWRALLTELDGARARAFERGEESALGDADAPGSSAYAVDAALLRSVLARGARVAGLHQLIESVRLLRTGSALVVVRTVDRLLPYAFVDTHGRVLARIPGKEPRMHDVAMVRTAVGWRVAQVRHVPGTGR